jgi:hypothetical protein
MNNRAYAGIPVLFLLLLLFGFGCAGGTMEPAEKNTIDTSIDAARDISGEDAPTFSTKSTGSTGAGDVLIELTPQKIIDKKMLVKISVNTHSVDLSRFDLLALTSLEFDGKKTSPLSAPRLSGHHSSGTLEFPVEGEGKKFRITILGIDSVEERVFEW